MKKYLLTLMLVILCVVALAFSVSAEEYTVSSNDQYEVAYNNAVSGDTIIIDSKLTCDIYANKSITYILKADWESSKLVVDQPNVEVSFIANGDDYKIIPTDYSTTDGWLNITTAHENVVINFGGINGGTLTIDGSKATHDRVTYATTTAITLNLLRGSAIANFNTTTTDDHDKASILYAGIVNMYDGCQIYGNKINGAPLIKSNDFNLYGGEIFGNLLTSTRLAKSGVGAIYAYRQFTMYGGKLYGNIFNAKNGPTNLNVAGFISVSYGYLGGKMVVYGGEIGDNYTSGTGGNEISAMFGINNSDNATSYFYYNTAVKGTRYIFTDTPVLSLDEETGKTIWQVSSYSSSSSNWNGFCWKQTKVSGDKAVAFIDAEKKNIAGNNFDIYTVISACIENAYPNSSSKIAIPGGYDMWSTSGSEYCHTGKAYTLDEITASPVVVYYSAYNAERVTVEGTTMCSGCYMAYTCSNPEHDLEIVSVSYGSYIENGIKVLKCNTCGLEKSAEVTAAPLFACQGYSAPEGEKLGIAIFYKVNKDAIKEYVDATGKSFEYGVFAVSKTKLGENTIFDNEGNATSGVISTELSSYEFSSVLLKITGFEESHKTMEFALGVYTSFDGNYGYIQENATVVGNSYVFTTYNAIIDGINKQKEVA